MYNHFQGGRRGSGGVASLLSFFFHDCCRFNIIEYRLSAEAFRNAKAISGFIIKEVAFGLIASAGKLDGLRGYSLGRFAY